MLTNLIFKVAKLGIIVPAAVSSLSMGVSGGVAASANQVNYADPNLESQSELAAQTLEAQANDQSINHPLALEARRARIQQILGVLNRVAEVSLEMDPDRASALEPVVLDLAEEAVALGGKDTPSVSADAELASIEKTVKRLSKAVKNSVEPEISL